MHNALSFWCAEPETRYHTFGTTGPTSVGESIMSKKEKIQITRNDDYTEVDSELTQAMEALDQANFRIESLLEEQHRPETVQLEEDAAPENPEDA
jgi:hypothetical protein